MHAVVVRVAIGDPEVAAKGLREQIIPRVSKAPGFITGHWTQSDDGSDGLSMIVFESEEAARAVADQVRNGPVPETVTIESVDVRKVVGNA